ncbi:MFS transporter [Streptomyces sp. NPDC056661]|uniref:MFS transporter n=1 Tax=Streptomyces sp. NPDC056661 TaxID=3345898 RepID=UPI0036994822
MVLFVIATCQLMLTCDGTIVSVSLPDIQSSLGLSPTSLAWVVNAYALAFGSLLLPGGRIGDLFGRRRIFIAGTILFVASSLSGGLAQDAASLVMSRALQGVGAAMAAPTALALIITTFDEGPSRHRALGVYTGVSAGGAAIGLVMGGILTDGLSWRWAFFVNIPVGLLVAALALLVLAPSPRRPAPFDFAGCATSVLAVTLIVYGFIRAADDRWDTPVTWGTFAGGAGLLGAFVVAESRARRPLVPLMILADAARAGSYGVRLCNAAAMMSVLFFSTLLMQNVLGYSALDTGLAFLPVTVIIFFTTSTVSRRLARVGPRPFLLAGSLLGAAGLYWLSLAGASSTYLGSFLGPIVLFGIGVGMQLVPANATAVFGVPQEEAGAASGLLNTVHQVGGSLGLCALTTVFSTATGREVLSKHLGKAPTVAAAAKNASSTALRDQVLSSGVSAAISVAALFMVGAAVISLVIPADRPA